jgi:hypothetical protein
MLWKLIFLFSLLFLLRIGEVAAQQRPVGTWKYYFNNRDYFHVENVESNMFVNAQRVLFDVQPNPLEVEVWDRINRLSDYSISTMAYDSASKRLLIAYDNTILDAVSFQGLTPKVTPNYDINNKILVADKTILKIKFFKNKAYLCSKIGIIVYRPETNDIESTYIIGNQGNNTPVMSLELFQGKFYAGTALGMKTALDLPAVNLQSYSNWSTDPNLPADSFFSSVQTNSEMWWSSQNQVITYDGITANQVLASNYFRVHKRLRMFGNDVYLLYDTLRSDSSFYASKILRLTRGEQIIFESVGTRIFDFTLFDNKIYVSGQRGFYEYKNNAIAKIQLSGMPYDNTFRLQQYGDETYANIGVMFRNLTTYANIDGAFVINGNGVYQSGLWNDSFRSMINQLSIITTPRGVYRAFARGGMTVEKNNSVTSFHAGNSKLEALGGEYKISDMVLNPIDSSLWIANHSSSQPLKCLTKDGKWYSFDLSAVTGTREIYRIIIDQGGSKWLLTRNAGLIFFNEQKLDVASDDIIRVYTNIPRKARGNQCELSIQIPLAAAVDRDGTLWIGANKGIGRITNCTWDPTAPCELDAPILNIVDPNDTVVISECAFLNTPVTAITADAGNNLWVATPDGIFYTSESMEYELIRLNRLNSPLSAQTIHDIHFQPYTGEIFMSTDLGLLSYVGQSISADRYPDDSRYLVIPNPVPADYSGLISIDGLPENAYYKITDVIGNLMYQGRANGSRVTWDGRSLSGVKVPTGVYFIFSGLRNLRGRTGIGRFTVIR